MTIRYQLLFLLIWLTGPAVLAQKKPTEQLPYCGAPELNDDQRRLLDREAKLALLIKRASNAAPTAITYVPIRPHIFRNTAGTGGISLAKLNRIMAVTNSYYLLNGYGIQFYFAGTTPDYIDNDAYATSFSSGNEETVAGARDVNNAMNMYFVNGFDQAGLGGYAYYPANGLYSTRSFILNESDENDLGNRLLPHELGHNFNLYHTFQGSTGSVPELVRRGAGANCANAGDLVCDTPADPYNRSGAATSYINGCQQYTGTAIDPQGAPYAPSITNIMSYYFPCTHDFTEGQYDRMSAGLALRQSHTAYSLTYAPTAVTAPANLSAALAGNGRSVTLTWQDLASNEMGYFLERSTQPNTGFRAIAGTGPDEVSFVDGTVKGQTTYYYRVRPSNTTTGSLSPVVRVAVPICQPTFSSSCSATNGLASVTINGTTLSTNSGCAVTGYSSTTAPTVSIGAGQRISFAATLLNGSTGLRTSIWTDFNRNGTYEPAEQVAATTASSAAPLSLTLLMPLSLTAGPLPLRIITATGTSPGDPCGNYAGGEAEDYVLTVTTSASCPAPTSLSATNVSGTSARLNWSVPAAGPLFSLQYRRVGTTSWETVTNITSTSLNLTGLVVGQSYEWQVLSVCDGSDSSPLSALGTFTTACALPTDLSTTPVYGNAAQLNWAGGPGSTYSVQWRQVGSATWISVSGIPTASYSLTGLTTNTAYEWQVAVNCATGISAYTTPVSFSTTSNLFYCQPANQSGCAYEDGLGGLTIGNFVLSSNSGCSPGAYQSYTTVGATLIPGQAYSFTATLLSTQWQEGLAMWIDYNKNGSFETGERVFVSSGTSATFIAGSVNLPAGTLPGLYTLRARIAYGVTPLDPCASVNYGETEDYVINVSSSCNSASASLVGSQTITPGQVVSLTATLSGDSPWSLSVSNGSSFTGLTSSPFTFTVSPAQSTTYTLTRVSNGCGSGVTSGTVVATVYIPCNLPTVLGETDITPTTARFFWTPAANASSYTIRIREVGTSPWLASSAPGSATSLNMSLGGNKYGKVMQWQLQSNCPGGDTSAYSPMRSFTINCPMPIGLNEVTSTNAATLRWMSAYDQNLNTLPATVQWRLAGNTDWTTVSSLYSNDYTLTGLTEGLVYDWRMATNCPEGGLGAYTGVRSFTAQCSVPSVLYAYAPSSTATRVKWPGPTSASYNVRWRVQNQANWTEGQTVTNTTSFTITGLVNSTNYEAQVRMVCSGAPTGWSASTFFQTNCNSTYLFTGSLAATNASLSWTELPAATYALEWRLAGEATWLNSLTTTSSAVSLTGLQSATGYEARVQVMCADGNVSAYSNVLSFSTLSCSLPTNVREISIAPTTAELGWNFQPQVSYRLAWRVAGTSTWPNSVTLPVNSTRYSLAGLTANTVYEWQIKSVCAATSESAFSTPRSFTAQCTPPLTLYSVMDLSSTGASVNWAAQPGSSYIVRWRVAGSGSWTEGEPVTLPYYSITGLTNATTYEWQVRTICAGTPTGWSMSGTLFTTQCTPTFVYVSQLRPATASLTWGRRIGATYRVEWRTAGTSTWPNSLTTTNLFVDITGLTPGTGYDVRVLVLCADGGNGGYSGTIAFTMPNAADLSLAMAVDKRTPALNEVITLTGTVSNDGPQSASGVQMVSLLPPNMSFVGSTQAGVTSSGGAVSVAVGTLAMGEAGTFTFQALVTQPGTYRLAAQLTTSSVADPDSFFNSGTSDGDDDAAVVDLRTREVGTLVFSSPNPSPRYLPPVLSNQPAPLANEADLSIDIRPRQRTLSAGGSTTLDLVIYNRGGQSATAVFVEFVVPATWTVTDSGVAATGGGTYLFQINNIDVGQSWVRSISVQVTGAGEQVIRARIFAASQPDSDSSHSNGYGLGEDDEATTTVRVR